MSVRPVHMLLALLAGSALAVACTPSGVAENAATDFTVESPRLAEALRLAAEDWARHGLDIANYVTINQSERGLPVYFGTQADIHAACPTVKADNISACTKTHERKLRFIIVDESMPDTRLHTVLLHELLHCLVPGIPHLGSDGKNVHGVFDLTGTSTSITQDDLDHLAKYTLVLPSEAAISSPEAT